MKSVYPHIIPNIEEWPINLISKDRALFVERLNAFSYERIMVFHGENIEAVLAKTIYLEKIRSKRNPWKVDPPDEEAYWIELEKSYTQALESEDKEAECDALLRRIIHRYSEEIAGNFSPKTFRFIRKFLAAFFKRLLNTAAGRNHRRFWGSTLQLQNRIKMVGEVEHVRTLFDKGVVVTVPTHFSNLDSILIGYAIDAVAGLPAFSYGAGLNLYDMELIAYFINRLGAYKVDRRKKNPLYLECLKSMACYSLQEGVNNIFFPGGTRSRQGSIEKRLKLGLLGSVMESQRISIQKEEERKIFIVPMVMGYHFVLEARHLINEYLKSTGKEKYIKTKDQYKSYRKIMKFIWSLFSAQSEITISLGEPMDVMGNKVDAEGISYDDNGNVVDLKDYFTLDGDIKVDSQRETVYTKILGDKILESYYRNNVVLSSHLVAFAAFRILMKQHRGLTIYDLVNISPSDFEIELDVFKEVVAQLVTGLKIWEEEVKIRLSDEIKLETGALIENGIKNLGTYHPSRPLKIKDNKVISEDIKLLFFYHNRLENYKMHRLINWEETNVKVLMPAVLGSTI